ncbi:MAG: class I SAM-dependent RNA methyltransferase [Rhodospirillales bacterium]|nr:class I SAM-dependent RNA methyltransferase [Rhodospirillales bacterium]
MSRDRARGRPARPARIAAPPPPLDLTISALGAEADGLAQSPDGTRFFVPLTLPGETVHARPVSPRAGGWGAVAETIVTPSPDRVSPPCQHFGACGGCTLQHWRDTPYLAWKTGLLETALRRAGYDTPPLRPPIASGARERRRMDLAVHRTAQGVILGLHRLRAAEVVDLATCHVLIPSLVALLAPLRTLLAGLSGLRRQGSVVANLVEGGADLLLRTDAALTAADRQALAGFARAHGVPRITWAEGTGTPEPAVLLRPATITLSGIAVDLPPGGFLQATARGEAAIVAAVLDGLPERLPQRARIAELYAGSGTLTFALAQRAGVAAWEGDAAAAAALRTAARRAGLEGRIAVTPRDLARQPLQPNELSGFAAVVLDPPHDGAAAQIPAIAGSGVSRIVYVSCNPAALGRDAAQLRAAGWALRSVQPIDQFVWSARLEAVAVFERSRGAGR